MDDIPYIIYDFVIIGDYPELRIESPISIGSFELSFLV